MTSPTPPPTGRRFPAWKRRLVVTGIVVSWACALGAALMHIWSLATYGVYGGGWYMPHWAMALVPVGLLSAAAGFSTPVRGVLPPLAANLLILLGQIAGLSVLTGGEFLLRALTT